MKKAVFVFLLIGTATLGFAQKAVIKDLTGTVELKLSGSSDFIPAGMGAEVAQDTIISTGFKSTALVQAGSAVITVRPLTRLTFTEIQALQETENLTMNLQAGRVRVDVNPPAGAKASLSISSPTATASVRGTSFEFDTRNLRVHSGTVAFMGKWGYQVLVQEGRASVVTASGTAAAPQVASGSGAVVSQQGIGAVVQGYDSAAGTTGGTGVISSPPGEPSDPSKPPATKPPSSGNTGGNTGDNTSGNTGSGVDITLTY